MKGRIMTALPKFEHAQQKILKEFAPNNPDVALSAGRLIVRTYNYGSSLAKFDELFDVVAADAMTFVPPIELSREEVEVAHYAGERYARTFGLEVSIPEGHSIPAEYSRIQQTEPTY